MGIPAQRLWFADSTGREVQPTMTKSLTNNFLEREMHRIRLSIFVLLGVAVAAFAADAWGQGPLAQPWQGVYSGADSNGSHVIGHWRFETGEVTKDSGPRGLAGKLDGVVAVEGGKSAAGSSLFRVGRLRTSTTRWS